ncbi:MAG: cobalt-precorrin-5B (C(1))-methyltransferase CbiD [Thermoleophilia bacterium]
MTGANGAATLDAGKSKTLRRGYTTGACAQAAVAAGAAYGRFGPATPGSADSPVPSEGRVEIVLPGGETAVFPYRRDDDGVVWVVKDAGDDPDVTHGLAIGARVDDTPGVFAVLAGPGVGTVTLPGLAIQLGAPAINPAPRDAILAELRRARPAGATATILAPGGEELARRTLNPRLGIVGGISILGTTGRVEPWSVEAMRDSLEPQLDVARARGSRGLVFVLGSKGRRLAEEAGVDGRDIVETGNEVGWMLERAADRDFSSVTVRGHVGKLVKLAAGIFDTHSRVADARLVTLAAYAGAGGVPADEVRALLDMNTADQGAAHLLALGRPDVLAAVAGAAAAACTERFGLRVRIVLLDRDGGVLAESPPPSADAVDGAEAASQARPGRKARGDEE